MGSCCNAIVSPELFVLGFELKGSVCWEGFEVRAASFVSMVAGAHFDLLVALAVSMQQAFASKLAAV